jgi:cytochrome P450
MQFPVTILHELIGLPDDDVSVARFHQQAIRLLFISSDTPQVAFDASAALHADLSDLVARRRREIERGVPGDDVVSAALSRSLESNAMSDDELVNFLRLLLPAGAETTSKAAGNMMDGLLTQGALDEVRRDRSLIDRAVDEALRWDGSIVMSYRLTTRPIDLGEVHLPAGTGLNLALASASRDEAVFANPERFDLHRPPSSSLAFGTGAHLCLGQLMARMEMGVALEVLVDRMPRLRLDPDDEPPVVEGVTMRAASHLRVRWD